MKLTPITFVITFLFIGNLDAQNSIIDSLEDKLQSSIADSSRASIFNQLALLYYSESIPKSKIYALKALALSHSLNLNKQETLAEYRLATIYDAQGNLDSANLAINKSILISLKLADSLSYANALVKKGSILSTLGDNTEDFNLFLEALKIADNNNHYILASNASSEMGRLVLGLGEVDRAISYFEQSFSFAEEISNDNKIIRACVNLAVAHDSVSIIRPYLERALKLAKQHNLNRELTYVYNTLGGLFSRFGNVDSSQYYMKLALSRAKAAEETSLVHMITKSIADVYLKYNLDSAEIYFQKLLLDFDVQTYSHVKDHTLRDLSYIKFQKKDFKSAFTLIDSSYNLAENRYRENMNTKVAEANALYEAEKKEAEIANQNLTIANQKNNRNIILLIASLLLLGISAFAQYFTSRQRRLKIEAESALAIEQENAKGLKELAKAKDNLFNNVSHELRTPLTMIIGPLESASRKIKNIPIREDVDLALNNSKRLLNLVNEILDLSKLDAQKLEENNVGFPLYSFLKRVSGSFSSLATSQRIILNDNLNMERISDLNIISDPGKIETICYNLISNAIKYSEGGDSISFLLDYDLLEQNILSISVIDEGVGIDEEDQIKIFDRYFQSNNASQNSGTGIGLALTKQLCELLNGQIQVKSEKGKGSEFNFSIPFERTEGVETRAETIEKLQETTLNFAPILIAGQRPAILIVEDDLQMARYLERILEDQFDITIAYNGAQALSLIKKQSFDLISSDVMMPEMDGFEFRAKINEDVLMNNTPFIMLTARNFPEDRLKGLRLGIDDYLIKPFNPDELKARMNNLLRNKISRAKLKLEEHESVNSNMLTKIKQFVESKIDEPELKISQLAKEVNFSERQFRRILKKLTGMSPVEFILEVRLQKAYQLLKTKSSYSINEIRYQVGVSSASYFTNKFRERFGVSPKDLL